MRRGGWLVLFAYPVGRFRRVQLDWTGFSYAGSFGGRFGFSWNDGYGTLSEEIHHFHYIPVLHFFSKFHLENHSFQTVPNRTLPKHDSKYLKIRFWNMNRSTSKSDFETYMLVPQNPILKHESKYLKIRFWNIHVGTSNSDFETWSEVPQNPILKHESKYLKIRFWNMNQSTSKSDFETCMVYVNINANKTSLN